MLRITTILSIILVVLLWNLKECNAQGSNLRLDLNPGRLLPASVILNPRLQVIPQPEINFRMRDLYDNGNVIPVNHLENITRLYSDEALSARVVPSIVFSPETDGIFRLIILSAIPDNVFEYNIDKLNLNPHINNH